MKPLLLIALMSLSTQSTELNLKPEYLDLMLVNGGSVSGCEFYDEDSRHNIGFSLVKTVDMDQPTYSIHMNASMVRGGVDYSDTNVQISNKFIKSVINGNNYVEIIEPMEYGVDMYYMFLNDSQVNNYNVSVNPDKLIELGKCLIELSSALKQLDKLENN